MSDRPVDVKGDYESAINMGCDEEKYDVFIVNNTEKEGIDTARHVASVLKQNSMSCIFDSDDENTAFPIGEPVFGYIIKWIEKSKKTLLIIRKDSINDMSLLLQAVLALHQSKKKDSLTLRILLHGVDENEIQYLRRDFLVSVPRRRLDFSKDEWKECLVSYMNEDIQLPSILPVGSLAHGLVFSHFIGYYKYVLPELQKMLIEHDIYKNNRGRVSTMYYLLIPSTCKVVSSLKGHDETNDIKIEEETKLEFTVNHAGKPRKISITIYSIRKGQEDRYYFFADCPNVLNAIYTMSEEKLAKVEVKAQVARFYHTLNEVIYHTQNEFCQHDPAVLLPYNAENKTMQSVLYEAIRRTLDKTDSKQHRVLHRLLPNEAKQPENDVTILCHGQSDSGFTHMKNIAEELKHNGLKVEEDLAGGNESLLRMKEAKWYVFVITKKTLDFTDPTALKCLACLENSITDDSISVVPVLVDVDLEEIPSIIKWVTLVSTKDDNYCKTILQIVTGLQGRIEELMKRENVECSCIEKLFIIVPWSCKTEDDLAKKANEECKEDAQVIRYIGKSEEVEKGMAGQHRKFYIHMYKYTDPVTNESVCFMSEYSAAINCIYEMDKLPFSGITREDMRRQCTKFVEVMQDMNRKAVKDKFTDISKLVEFVLYDDSKQTLLEAIRKQIIQKDYNKI